MNQFFYLCPAMVALGTLLHIVGMATPNWLQSTDAFGHEARAGLWKVCYDDDCDEYPSKSKTSELMACEAFSILAILPAVAVLVLCLLHLVKRDAEAVTKRVQIIASLVLSLLSGIFVMICIFVWRFGVVKTDESTGFSFYLCIVGGSLLIISSGLFTIYQRQALRRNYQVIR